MFLKTLTLKGFKSFADTTTLEFEPGITVVVGPNGSGKSNIVDAVAWVLGAQGPRTLRSGKMEDVIFAGTAKRAPLGRAEVSLTIDNSSGLIPIDFTEVTITRTLWRSGESEYAINGAPCRLLDIQELLSDTGVGRQQHVIVSQGQLDGVLNAQAVDRRLIIEEAAGVLKFRRRREKAQRRLDATEGDLLRVQDLLREVRRQLRPLERQADAARRHGDVVAELAALRRFVAGRELTALRNRAASIARVRADETASERSLVRDLAGLDADVLAAEAALTAADRAEDGRHRRDALADDVARAEGLRERARGLSALVAERGRSLERLRSAELDADLIATLEAEGADVAASLVDVDAEAAGLVPEAEELAVAEAALAADRAAVGALEDAEDAEAAGLVPEAEELAVAEAALAADRAAVGALEDAEDARDAGAEGARAGTADGADHRRPATGAAEVRGELAALRSAAERGVAERRRAEERRTALAAKVLRLGAEAAAARSERDQSEGEGATAATAAAAARSALVAAEAALDLAERRYETALGRRREWAARVHALTEALDEARARTGAERLASLDGLVGTLFELVEVDDGWEAAFEAAIGEAAAAVIVEDVDVARAALSLLGAGRAGGAVLALGQAAGAPPAAVVPGASALRDHVRAVQPGVPALLDRLLARTVVVEGGWSAALDLAVAHPDVVVVTRGGDRFASTGWRAGAGTAVATGAALEEARHRAGEAEGEAVASGAARADARQALALARQVDAEAARAVDDHEHRRSRTGAVLERVQREAREVDTEVESVAGHLAELSIRLQRDEARVAALEKALPDLEAAEAADHERAAARRAARGRIEQREAALRALRTDLEVRAAALEERRVLLSRRRDEISHRLEGHRAERDRARERRDQLTGHVAAVGRLQGLLARHLADLDGVLLRLREERRAHAERTATLTYRLEDLRRTRAATERDLAGSRERLQRAELDDAEIRVRIETATDSVRRELDCEPEALMEAACPPLPPGTTADQRVRELERDLRLMGPINPLALEEHAALLERHTFLEAQLEDVKASRRELAKVIKAIDVEIVEVFGAAYGDVAENFANLFATLFPGGTGRLRLTDPDDLLETGIEVEARPSGKNVKRLSLLSGGERSLTAMAFLFAVFRSRPSPFYLMDEVEAALDDVNLHRFLDLVHEFRDEAQLLIVSHQKRTMEAADCLYGVTMQPAGSSKVISERVAAGA